jgi:glyoxylase-like metal-dependent hydrolase (beta-lactamase superfamily II)
MRRFLAAAAVITAPLAGQAEIVWRDTTLAPNVRAIMGGANGTVLVIATSEGAVLVDAQSAEQVAALAGRIGMPVRLVINTHYHEDHTGGNARFRADGAAVLAHANVLIEAARDTTIAELGWDRDPLPEAAMPTLTVAGDTTLVIGSDTIVVFHLPHAHTSGDLAVWLPQVNILHTGDIFEQDAYPFVDWWGGGSLDGIKSALARFAALANDRTAIVPGHGHVSSRAELLAFVAMLELVEARVRTAIDAGRTVLETMDLRLSAEFDDGRGGLRPGRRFVGILYLGLSVTGS